MGSRGSGRLCLLLLVLLFRCEGQTSSTLLDGTTPAGLAPGSAASSYPLSGFEHYNPFNGSISLAFPLYHVGGRGEAGFDIVYRLASSWVDTVTSATAPGLQNNTGPNWAHSVAPPLSYQYLPGPGIGFGYLMGRTAMEYQPCTVGGVAGSLITNSLSRLTWMAPDGTETELIDVNTNGSIYSTNANPCLVNLSGAPVPSWDAGRGTVFTSRDGTSTLQFVSDSTVMDWDSQMLIPSGGVFPLTGYLHFPNGVTYRISNSQVQWIKDRNGNEITLSYSHTGATVVDSVNRTVSVATCSVFSNWNNACPSTITYPSPNATPATIVVTAVPLQQQLRPTYSGIKTYGQLFPEVAYTNSMSQQPYNPSVASSITYNDGSKLTLHYDPYGEVARVDLPTGGAIEYDYGDGNNGSSDGIAGTLVGGVPVMVYRRLQERREYSDGSHLSSKTDYIVTYSGGNTIDTDTTYDASGNVLATVVHQLFGQATGAIYQSPILWDVWNTGKEFETDEGAPILKKMVSVYSETPMPWCTSLTNCGVGPGSPANNPHLMSDTTTLTDTNAISQVTYQYDSYNNIQDKYEYDWGKGAVGPLLRHMHSTYNTGSSYVSENLVSLPTEVKVYDGSGTLDADTQYAYDANPVAEASGIVGHDNANFSGGGARGNVTSAAKCATPGSCGWLTTTSYYDIAGNTVKVTDANGHSTSYGYADNYGDGQNRNTYAHPTAETNALGQTQHWQWHYNLGKATLATDINGVNTSYGYNDSLGRLTQVVRAAGLSGFQTQTLYSYQAYASASQPFTVTKNQDQNTFQAGELKTVTTYDGFGREAETDEYEGATYVATTKSYDGLGRLAATTNPSRPGDGLGYVTQYAYDALGRVLSVTTADGAVAATSYSGVYTTATDQAGHARVMQTDALGRLTAVWEDPGSSPHYNYLTTYAYDALGDLTQVTQCGNVSPCTPGAAGTEGRSLSYDGLGRLKRSVQPESGVTSYSYDAVGNLWTKTDARNTVTTYSYDALNRVLQRTYSDGTPAVNYQYDAAWAGYSWGHLTQVSNVNSTTTYLSIDPLGRVLASAQEAGGQAYVFGYAYNLAGALTSETYPSGRVIATGYDGANRANAVTGSYNGVGTAYASGTWYWPHGAVGYYQTGSGAPPNAIWAAFEYNQRLQPSKIYAAVGNSVNSFVFLECYGWGTPVGNPFFGTCPTAGGASDNGNLLTRISYEGGPGVQSSLPSYTDSFTYDTLNRLTYATDSGGWWRNFGYDQYGNGWVPSTSAQMSYGPATPAWNVYNTKNQIGSSPYDAAGNMLALPPGMTFTYDAENRQVTETNSNGMSATYYYDGDGRRVQKLLSNGVSTVYVYNAMGRLAAEYESMNPAAPPCTTCYLLHDHLGSLRLVTDANANVIARHDYLPFGDEIPGGVAGRSMQFGAWDNATQRFTGKERDTETSLDYFGARYYGAGMERFLSADPENASGLNHMEDPQSWNAYSYVRNNPLLYTDPDGQNYQVCDQQGQNCANLTDEQWADFRDQNGIGQQAGGQLYVTNEDGSYTNIGTATWYDPTATNAVGFLNFAIGALASNYAGGAAETGLGVAADAFAFARAGRAVAQGGAAAGAARRTIKIIEEAGGAIHVEVSTGNGTYEVIANVRREAGKIVLDGAHIEGSGPGQFGTGMLREIREAIRQFGQEQGVSEVVVNPGVRTSGANPGRAMSSFSVRVN